MSGPTLPILQRGISNPRPKQLATAPCRSLAVGAMTDNARRPLQLSCEIGVFDATMLVMGGMVGAGIFMNPSVVARAVHSPILSLIAWGAGGVVALIGAFIYAELASRMPEVGGQYAYLREAYHPIAGFLYGWVLLLVIQTGGMAAVTVTFAKYFLELTHAHVSERCVSVFTLAVLTFINCLGVKAGSRVQSFLMVLKIAAIAGLVMAGLYLIQSPHPVSVAAPGKPVSFDLVTSLFAAMLPVLFSYGGWQTSNFIAGEIHDARKNLPRALLAGVCGVVVLYLAVSFVCVRSLGQEDLARTSVPASAVMRLALGERGARLIALGIAVSTLGFLSQCILTGPRVYFAMAADGLFFSAVARVSKRSRVPIAAIVLQSACAALIAIAGRYEQILNYAASMDFLFIGLTATCLFVFRAREKTRVELSPGELSRGFEAPGHPFTTLFFVAACWVVVAATFYKHPLNSLLGVLILLTGIPAYLFWRRPAENAPATSPVNAASLRREKPSTRHGVSGEASRN